MPLTRVESAAPPPWAPRSVVLGIVLWTAWFVSLGFAIDTSDDWNEVFLLVAALVLGIAAGGLLLSRLLAGWRLRLRVAHKRLEAMSTSDVLSWECDAAGHITHIGDRSLHHFGWTPEEMIGRNVAEIVHPQELDRLTTYLASGTGWTDQRWRCLHRDGSEKWFSGSAVPDLGRDGTIVGYVGSTLPLGRDALDQQRFTETAELVYARLEGGDITPVFQPILSVTTGRLIGAEGLTRFPGSDLPPDEWFNSAAEVGLGVELELEALRRLLSAAHDLPDDLYISVNVGPGTLVRPELMETLVSSGIPMRRIVLELTEHASIEEYGGILAAVAALRDRGVRLAVDDAGAGYASFRHILRLAPEVIKLDRSLVAGLHDDPALRALGAAVVMFALEMGSTVTAEGVETPEELRCAQALGIHAAQGYLFGNPVADWSTWSEWHARGAVYSVVAAVKAG